MPPPVNECTLAVMCDTRGACKTGWKEQLPASCPPADAVDAEGAVVFRFVAGPMPTDDDFRGMGDTDPNVHLMTRHPCRCRALSVWTCPEKAQQVLATFPSQSGKKLARVVLTAGAGVIQPTGQRHHSSWWRCGAFNPASLATVEPHVVEEG